MLSASTLTLLPLLAAAASANIVGIALPSTIAPNSDVPITLITSDYIQTVEDIAISFGSASPGSASSESLGTAYWGSKTIDPSQSNSSENITETIKVPGSGVVAGGVVVSASLFSLFGADYSGTVKEFRVSVTVGTETGGALVSSH